MIDVLRNLWIDFLCNTRFEYIDLINLFMVVEAKILFN